MLKLAHIILLWATYSKSRALRNTTSLNHSYLDKPLKPLTLTSFVCYSAESYAELFTAVSTSHVLKVMSHMFHSQRRTETCLMLARALFSPPQWLEKLDWVFQASLMPQRPPCQYLQKYSILIFVWLPRVSGGFPGKDKAFFCLSQKGSLVSSQRKCASYSHVKPILRSNP